MRKTIRVALVAAVGAGALAFAGSALASFSPKITIQNASGVAGAGGGAKPEDDYNFYGMAVAYTMVDTLKHAGKNPTRESLLRAATHLDEVNPFMRPGIKIQTSPTSYYPITKSQILRYDVNHWVARGGLVSARG